MMTALFSAVRTARNASDNGRGCISASPTLLDSGKQKLNLAGLPALQSAQATCAAASTTALLRQLVPETIKGRFAERSATAILSANALVSLERCATAGALASIACATENPSRARSSGAACITS